MIRKFRTLAGLTSILSVAALVATVSLTGCKDDPVDSTPQTVTVNVTMKDGQIIMPSTLKAGPTKFVVKNDGTKEHKLEVEDKASGAEKETASIQPGGTGTVEYDLPAGKLFQFYCPVQPGHEHKTGGELIEITISQ